MLPRLGTQVWGAKCEKLGCPAAPIQQPRERRPFWEEMLLHVRWACSGSRFERGVKRRCQEHVAGRALSSLLQSCPLAKSCELPVPKSSGAGWGCGTRDNFGLFETS